MVIKMGLEMKNRSNNVNRPRPRNGQNTLNIKGFSL